MNNNEKHANDFVKFLGTAGARFVVFKQLRASGGLWFSFGDEEILVDPGPGSLVRCLNSRPKLDPYRLNGIILTHRHLDHSNDVNAIIEAMTNGGREKKGFLYAPGDAFGDSDPVIRTYVHPFLEEIEYLEEGKTFPRPGFKLETPLVHSHPVETYGLKFHLPYGIVSLIADTAYFPQLLESYKDSDVLILNVVIYRPREQNSKIYHLNFDEAEEIVKYIKPKAAILTHFGMTMLQNKPYYLAKYLQEKTGIQVIAASDGLKLELPQMVSAFYSDSQIKGMRQP